MLFLALLACACNPKEDNIKPTEGPLSAVSDVKIVQSGETTLDITWKDTNTKESGYAIYLIMPNDIDNPILKATLGVDATSFTLEDASLEPSKSYYIGIQAKAEEEKFDSKIVKTLFTMAAPVDPNAPKIYLNKADSFDACISLYIDSFNLPTNAEMGVCWAESAEASPSVMQSGVLSEDGKSMIVISNALLDYGKEYYFKAYAKIGSQTIYSEQVLSASLKEELKGINLDWEKQSIAGLTSSVEVYSYTGKLNSRNLKAWYAIADLSKGDVEFKVTVPSSAITIDDQYSAAENCLVMVNGGYFYNGRNTGIAYVAGQPSGSVSAVRGSLKTSDEEYNQMYNITRGIMGVDANGTPAVYWASTDASGKHLFYDRPLPSVKGEAKYPVVSSTNPFTPINWAPKYAQSAGPLLLIDGKCPIEFETTSKGSDFYYTNYEIIPYDIWGENVKPDRTAAGYTADGKVVLLILDGRIESSDGATLVELAQIMKGIGCVGAVNFDGGGSTGMMAGGVHLNDQSGGNRPVVSTLGFYKK